MKYSGIIISITFLFFFSCSKEEINSDNTVIGSGPAIAKADSMNRFELLPINNFPYYVTEIVVEPNKTGWFATQTGGLYKKVGSTWTQYITSNSGIAADRCNSMLVDNGTVYLCTSNGLSVFDGLNWTTYNSINSGLQYNNLKQMARDINGDFWLASNDKIYLLSNGVIVPYVLTNQPNNIYDVVVDQVGLKYLLTDIGLISFDAMNENVYTGLITNPYELGVDNNNVLWIVGPGGLQKFDGQGFIKYDPPANVPFATTFFAIDFDNYNNIWIGSSGPSYNGALIQFTPQNVTWRYLLPTSQSAFDSYSVSEIFVDNLGNKWLSRALSTVSVYNDGGIKY